MTDGIPVKCEHSDLIDPKTLNPHPKNPNKHPSSQIKLLAKSIGRFGWRHPIVVSRRSGLIVAGHARRQAAIELKCKAPIDIQDFDSEADEVAVLLADNILPELSEMDHQLFMHGKELLELQDIPLDMIGIPVLDVPEFNEESEDSQPELDKKKEVTCPNCDHVFEP